MQNAVGTKQSYFNMKHISVGVELKKGLLKNGNIFALFHVRDIKKTQKKFGVVEK